MPTIAVVLSGCGVFDGSEIHEAVSILIHLSRHGAKVSCFAPDIDAPVVNHATGKPSSERRNVMVEAARIARGKIAPLSRLKARDFDAVVFPGGFGAAKNLSSFATDGAACTVIADVERTIKEFHSAGKAVGMCCIAPVIAAKVLGKASGGPGVTVTIGDDKTTAAAIATMGSTNQATPVTQACIDDSNALITAPAYMYGDAPVHEVHEGIGAMIDGVMDRIGARKPGQARGR